MQIRERAWAKLNITLDISGQRPDGYHEMKMIMLAVSLCDELSIKSVPGGEIRAKSNLRYLPGDERNISCRAARLFMERAGTAEQGLEINMKKRIPVCAGLGGGSSDGAAVLRALNRAFGSRFTPRELEEMSRPLGSDVPFCICGGTQLASGRGDELEPLPPFPDCGIVICKPEFSIRTPELFARIDERPIASHPDTAGVLEALEAGDLRGIARRMYNVFEDALPRRCGKIGELKSRLIDLGALGAVMSGTGSAVFGIFETHGEAISAHEEMKKHCRECFTAYPMPRIG